MIHLIILQVKIILNNNTSVYKNKTSNILVLNVQKKPKFIWFNLIFCSHLSRAAVVNRQTFKCYRDLNSNLAKGLFLYFWSMLFTNNKYRIIWIVVIFIWSSKLSSLEPIQYLNEGLHGNTEYETSWA